MSVLKTFCCCCSLRTGAIIAAVAGILLAVIGIVMLYAMNVDVKTIILDDILSKLAIKIIFLINFVMTIIISLVLLVGIAKRNVYLMVPWVVLGIMLVLGLLISVIQTAYNFYYENDNFSGTLWLVLGLISTVVYVYMWLVVFSFFQIVWKEHQERSKYDTAPFRRYY